MSQHDPYTPPAFSLYKRLEDLPEPWRDLLEAAALAREHSYSPYSRFRVGAAILLGSGTVVSGFNIENASYPVCMCAEQTTLAAARTQYVGQSIEAMAITVRTPEKVIEKPATPCGQCRQMLFEQERINGAIFPVILRGEKGPIWVFERAADLLPYGFLGDLL